VEDASDQSRTRCKTRTQSDTQSYVQEVQARSRHWKSASWEALIIAADKVQVHRFQASYRSRVEGCDFTVLPELLVRCQPSLGRITSIWSANAVSLTHAIPTREERSNESTGAVSDIKVSARRVPVHTAFEHKFHGRIIGAAAGSQVRTREACEEHWPS
jgi:hypothetical protein